ncbi:MULTISPECIES: hypothetical protein [unclassified Polynucleobacter]|uniref:hypothetical protein n=1 Tax=unclassified Polynucleobacter TaxID=2640945 RepID=UPI000BD0C90C|nr:MULTISPECIES: hypothetical protein [unclassified Polynucleobacter]OYY07857.1 MAG: hypothetical protein B7Y67_17430 [Polynucleobacter sp. 35-46-11]OZA75681.1 MAG: hypothetical protein B7X71_10885 [Polynucleobacter sp. 39-46-10]
MSTQNPILKTACADGPVQIPVWVIALQCVTFVVLYSVWILPEIASWRNTSLVLGAVIGLYVSYQYRSLLLNKRALPIWLIGILFVWASFHLLFLSQNPAIQLLEFKGIWKRAFLAAIFALGLGLSIANNLESVKRWAWPLIYLGLLMPTLIYLLKWTLTFYGQSAFGFEPVPAFLRVYPSSQPFYVPKTDYVVFCLPTLAVALGQILALLRDRRMKWAQLFVYSTSIAAISFVFYGQNIKNGFVYEALLFILFLLFMVRASKKSWSLTKVGIIAVILIGVGFVGQKHIQQNDSWSTFAADAKIAVQLDRYQEWKFNGEKGYPVNELGKTVSGTNYERIAWGLVGMDLFRENLLGYGLIENSFGPLVNKKWPESSVRLTHAHGGWLDLALGLGLPGIGLVLAALALALKLAPIIAAPWSSLGRWVLISTFLLWCTTEVSNNGNFDPLLFWITLTASLALRVIPKPKTQIMNA